MEILGIGPLEFLLILLIMLVVLGPREMVKTGHQLGSMIRRIIRSPIWQQMMSTSQEIRNLPTRLVRESGLDEDVAELKKATQIRIDPVRLDQPQPVKTTSPERTISTQPSNGNESTEESPASAPSSAEIYEDPGPQI